MIKTPISPALTDFDLVDLCKDQVGTKSGDFSILLDDATICFKKTPVGMWMVSF
jgi:hypothetical protein